MEIAVLGTGTVGRTLAGRLAELGHGLTIGTRHPDATSRREEYAAWAAGHPAVRLADLAQAAASAELVVNAVGGAVTLETLDLAAAENLVGKVLVDVSNPLDLSAGFPPRLFTAGDDSVAERVQRAHPGARVVKTLNTLTAELMAHPEALGEPTTVFLSGDDADAKDVVRGLLHDLGHRDVLDLGGIETARGPEQYLVLWLRTMQALGTASFNLRIVR
jgi:predicted dinucleotide-binding enzyme